MTGFWTSQTGESIRLYRRRLESLQFSLDMEPPTKKSRAGTRRKASEALTADLESNTLLHHALTLPCWPKPRAAIALDVSVHSTARNGARVDSICKWLLDELADRVYSDDRQVKLLFARVFRPPPPVPHIDDDFSTSLFRSGPFDDVEPRSPTMHVTVQTRSSVLDDLRVASRLDTSWERFDDLGPWHPDPVDADFQRDGLVEYQALFDPENALEAAEHRQVGRQIDFHDQAQQQRVVDLIFSSLLTGLSVDRFGAWNKVRHLLGNSPYIFDLGALPERGRSDTFRQDLRAMLQSRRRAFPALFPLRAASGISMILFEKAGAGKDLDNLVRAVLPAILDVLRPPLHDLPGWVADEPDPETGAVDIPFIEVAAIPADRADMPPGSVVFGLSSGHRYQSWWERVGDHVERTLQEEHWP